MNRDTIQRLLKQNLFDVRSAILSEAGEPNTQVPEYDIYGNQAEENNYALNTIDNAQALEEGITYQLYHSNINIFQ